jgi:NodT family efflux transporter outer membrane factor (OMF) lipoprotein
MTGWRRVPALAVAISLTGCAVGPDFQQPSPPPVARITAQPLAQQTSGQAFVSGGEVPSQWWKLFKNTDLDALVDQALAANPDLASARAALRVANANAEAERASFFPGLSAGFDATRQKTSGALSPVLAGPAQTFNLYTAQLSISYAPDLFGGTRRSVEGAEASARAQGFALRAARLALAGNVTLTAIQYASLRDQVAAQQDILAEAIQLRDLFRDQVARGAASQAALAAQDTMVAQVQAALAALRKQLSQQRDLLAALGGRLPAQFAPPALGLEDLSLPHELPISLPADLVRQRPDVRIAEENLHAANAQVGVAIASMLPSISLSAGNGSAASAIGALFGPGNGFWSLGAGVLQPLFDGGALLAHKRAADATLDKAKADYQSAVVTAFQNTADALEAIYFDADALSAVAQQEASAKTALQRARRQQELGNTGMPAVLLAQQAYQQAEIALLQVRASRLADTVGLFTALGGGWWRDEANSGVENHEGIRNTPVGDHGLARRVRASRRQPADGTELRRRSCGPDHE